MYGQQTSSTSSCNSSWILWLTIFTLFPTCFRGDKLKVTNFFDWQWWRNCSIFGSIGRVLNRTVTQKHQRGMVFHKELFNPQPKDVRCPKALIEAQWNPPLIGYYPLMEQSCVCPHLAARLLRKCGNSPKMEIFWTNGNSVLSILLGPHQINFWITWTRVLSPICTKNLMLSLCSMNNYFSGIFFSSSACFYSGKLF